ncbi:MAG: hypothetical protein ACLGI7_06620 [Gammaproteobacteria bacterium]
MNDKPNEKPRWLDEPRNVDKLVYALYACCALLFAADLFYVKHPHFSMEGWFGYYAIYGFVACVVLVLAAKQLRRLIKRDESHYEAERPEDQVR